jgi:hypothetical protein
MRYGVNNVIGAGESGVYPLPHNIPLKLSQRTENTKSYSYCHFQNYLF